MSQSKAAKTWSRHARSTARRFNFAWVLERFGPMLLVAGVLYAAAVLYFRSSHRFLDPLLWSAIGVGAVALLGLGAWLFARRRFISSDQGMVRLESKMGLHNALSTAEEGITTWPELPEEGADDGYDWNWGRVVSPFVLTALLVLAAFLIPVPGLAEKDPDVAATPKAWDEMEKWIDKMEESGVIEEEAIEDARERLEKLAGQKEENWFSHSSLEATDTLRDQLKDSLQELNRDSSKAERSLSSLAEHSEKMSSSAKDQLMGEYQDALEQMGENSMTPNQELMDALGNIDPSQIPQLSPEQLQEMKEALQNAQQAAQDALGSEADLPPLDGT